MLKKYSHLFCILSIIGLSFVIYSNTFFADFQFDDGVHIPKQENFNDIDRFLDLSSWMNINERPLSFFTLSLNHSIHKLDVFGYHLFNLFIHIFAGIFVYLLCLLVFKSPVVNTFEFKGNERIMALFVALVFIAHPIQTESVTYIVQRMTSMASLFYLASIYFYLYGRFEYVKNASRHKISILYFLSFLFALAALLSKQIAVSIPLSILLVEFFFVRKRDGKLFKKYILSFAGILLLIAIVIIAAGLLPKETASISRGDYLVTQFRVLVKYFQLLIFPVSQNLDYDFPISNSFWGLKEINSLLFDLAILFLAIRLYKKHKIISFGIFWIFISLLVESSIIPIKDVIFEHRLYLPMFGFALVLVVLVFKYFRFEKINYAIIILIIIVMMYGFKSHARNKVWQTRLSLWTDVVKKSPNKARAHMNLGEAYFHLSQHQKALYHFNKAIEVEETPTWLGYFNRAEVAAYLNKPKAAIMDLNQSIRYKDDFAESYDSRGVAKIQIQDFQGALTDFDRAIELKPNLESAWFNRANAKIYIKDFDGALSDYNQAIRLNPRFAEAYNNRGQLKLNLKNFEAALDDLNEALLIKPDFEGAYNNRAKANMGLNNLDAAIADLGKSIFFNNRNPLVYRYRAICYYHQSDYKRAYNDFLSAAELGDNVDPALIKSLQKKIQSLEDQPKN